MKKRIVSLLLAAALLTGAASAAGEEGVAEQPDLDLSAASAVLVEKETGSLLYEKESHQQLEPASVTKVMTLLLIMEDLDSGRLSKEDLVTVSAAAAGMGGSQVYLKEGEQLSAGELIKCIGGGHGGAPGRQRGRLRGADEPAGPGAGHEGHSLCQLHRPSGRRAP